MSMDYECRIPDYHADDTWLTISSRYDTEDAVVSFARLMNERDFELWLREDDPRDVWVRKVGNADHMVYSVSFEMVKHFRCEMKSTDQ